MEFVEDMDPIEREIMILEAVQGSVAVEGMKKAAQECQAEIRNSRYLTIRGSNNLASSE